MTLSISTITATPAFRGPGPGPTPVQPVAPAALAPAVRLDIRSPAPERADAPKAEAPPEDTASPMQARVRIDRDTRTVVYQEVDPASGDVVIQLPDPVVLKARAYAEQAAAARAPAEHPLDRQA